MLIVIRGGSRAGGGGGVSWGSLYFLARISCLIYHSSPYSSEQMGPKVNEIDTKNEMYMANVKTLCWGPNATYIPMWLAFGVTQILCFALG